MSEEEICPNRTRKTTTGYLVPANKPHFFSRAGLCIYGCGERRPETIEERAAREIEESKKRAAAGIAAADDAAHESWKLDVDEFGEEYLRTHRTMFTDEIQRADGFPAPHPDRKRALGPRYLSWSKRGWMRKATLDDFLAGTVNAITRPSVYSNGAARPVWISKIYETTK